MSLFKSFYKFRDNVALISSLTGPIRYKDIENKLKEIKRIIPKRSLVFLFTENSVPSIIFYLSLIKNDSIIMLLDIKMDNKNIFDLVKSYKPSFIIAPERYLEDLNFRIHKNAYEFYNYRIYRTDYNKISLINKNLCLLLPTSGSMGSRRFIMLSKENIKKNTNSIIKYLKINSRDRAITTMPYGYSYMLSIVNTHLETGASILLTKNTLIQKEFWNEYYENKITSFSGVPYIYEILLKLGLNKIYTSSLNTITQAGGKLDVNSTKQIIKFCKTRKIKFFTMYGQTEASPRMTYLDWKCSNKKIGSIGKAIPGGKIWLQNKNNKKILKPREIGELVYKGKNVCLGYSKNFKDLKSRDKNKGILKTGDLAYFDEDKFFYITGRKKRIIKIFGNRFDLNEIEERMKKQGFEVVCQGLDDKLTVYYKKNSQDKKILKKIGEITGQNKVAFNLVSLSEFPRTLSGKINYSKLNYKNAEL